ncbi:hypothetical protein COS75_02980 [Candidatus Pacearchaeota archaeon CG06_land_8_20_14_3_00_35_12]|nr:MAG: hypothetical protein COS75_02980 [Candidatus Pacearchaeota archaeon CG06_land_8_20_14_3_00_35_12]
MDIKSSINTLLIKSVEDEKELGLLREFMLIQPQFYPKHDEWLDGKCIPRVEKGAYNNIIVLSDRTVIGDAIYHILDNSKVEIKNFRIDPEYRRRDLGHFILKQVEFLNPKRKLILDVTTDNFSGVEFFIRNSFNIVGKEQLYKEGQFEYLMEKPQTITS